MVLPLVMVTESQQAWSFLVFVLLMQDFHTCSVLLFLCTKILLRSGSYMYEFDTYIALPFLLLLLTPQLVDVTWCVIWIKNKALIKPIEKKF